MLQRIQTVFLLLGAIAFGLLFVLPFAESDIPGEQLLADNLYTTQDHILLMILAGTGAALAFFNIFRYANRPFQLRLNYLLIVLAILFAVVGALLFFQEGDAWMQQAVVEDRAGVFLPVTAIIFIVLANYFIKKDDKKIRSAYDRLR